MKRKMDLSDLSLVYSSDKGRTCPKCEQAIDSCICKQIQKPLGDGNVRVRLETKGRKGKGVSTISGLAMTSDELKDLGQELKKKCGVGGAVKEGIIEIQGDKVLLILEILAKKGIAAKKSGG